MLKVFEAFAGVGSQRMALRNLGIEHEVVGICDIDKFALKAYEAIHGECPNFGDISKINANDLPDIDLFTYSFPCQDLSVAGKQKGLYKGTRSGLLYECEKIIEAKKPKYLLLENVKNLVSKNFKNDFDKWLKYLESLGYSSYWKVLNAKDYGVPQNRERVFAVSILDDIKGYEFPPPTKLDKCIKDILEESIEERFYINKPFKLVNKSHIAELDMTGHEQIKRVYSKNNVSPCLTTMQGGHREPKILEGGRVRKLTPLECWRLMGFKDEDYNKAKGVGISNSQLYKQAGNSIVVDVLEGIFKNLFLEDNKKYITETEKIKFNKIEVEQFRWVI